MKPTVYPEQENFLRELVRHPEYHTNGHFAGLCETWLETRFAGSRVWAVSSCTHALEAAFMALNLPSGSEVIMPSWNFVSSANAAVLAGLKPVWADIDDNGNICPESLENSISPNTKAILIMHYLGIPAQMGTLMAIAQKHNLFVIEDAAYGLFSAFEGKPLGSIGHIGCISFDHTKPLHAGRGGAMVLNDLSLQEKVECIVDMGTDKAAFLRGEKECYQWVSVGSKYRMPEASAALLYAGLMHYNEIRRDLESIILRYKTEITIPVRGVAGAFSLAGSERERNEITRNLQGSGVYSTFHYQPLHLSVFGTSAGLSQASLNTTEKMSRCIFRLPLFSGMTAEEVSRVVDELNKKQI